MPKEYNLHSVRIEDDVWRQVKESGVSVNQLLRRAFGMTWTQTRHVLAGLPDVAATGALADGLSSLDVVSPEPSSLRGKVATETHRAPLLKPGEKTRK